MYADNFLTIPDEFVLIFQLNDVQCTFYVYAFKWKSSCRICETVHSAIKVYRRMVNATRNNDVTRCVGPRCIENIRIWS